MFRKRSILSIILVLTLLLSSSSVFAIENNAASKEEKTLSTSYAYYNADQYMWKATLYVAKSDTVTTEASTLDDFYKIGTKGVYMSPVSDWSKWTCGARPSSLATLNFSTSDKVSVLKELKAGGNDLSKLSSIGFTDQKSTTYLQVESKDGVRLPPIPGVNDGYYYGTGDKQTGLIGTYEEVNKFFTNSNIIYNVLTYYSKLENKTPEDLVKALSFTIGGVTQTNWDPNYILPIVDNKLVQQNRVQWLLVYEPVSIVYVGNTGYALTATDFAVMQAKQQMDWWYDESAFPDWAGKQSMSWKPNGERQNIARLAFLVLGNSIVTNKTWFGLEKSTGIPDGNAAIPDCRWTPLNQIKYGGWGMVRWDINKTPIPQTGEFSVTFTDTNGTKISTAYYDKDKLVTKPTDPVKAGYTFSGWYKDQALTIPFDFANDKVSGNMQLYAKFVQGSNPGSTYTVTFETNGGSTITPISVVKDTTTKEPIAPVKDGYNFGGWFSDDVLKAKFDFNTTIITSDKKLYALWVPKDITVKYSSDGKTVNSITTKAGQQLVKPVNPTKTDYLFVGWFKDSEFKDIWDFNNDIPTKDLTLYAQFIKDE